MNKILPERANLGHLKDQARDLLQAQRKGDPEAAARIQRFRPRLFQAAGAEAPAANFSLHEALWIIAREYGFASWPRLKAATGFKPESVAAMKKAIDEDDPERVRTLLAADADLLNQYLVRANYYYGNQRSLAYAAQRGRSAIVKLLLEAGADIHAEGNLAIARASMSDANIPIMEMFLVHGMDVNCPVYDWGPLLTYPAETQAPGMLRWLLDHGADPNLRMADTRYRESAWTALLEGYDRSPRFHECVNVLIAGGAEHKDGPFMDLYRGRFGDFAGRLKRDPAIAQSRYDPPGANLSLQGTTLLHLCADWNFLEAAKALLAHGADLNAPAPLDAEGMGGYTPIFHTVNSIFLWSFPMLEWLLAEGADLSIRATFRWGDTIFREVTPLSYALAAKRNDAECSRVVELLKSHGARESP